MRLLVPVLTLAVLVSGCAVGNTHTYDDVLASLSYQGTRKVAVGTEDQRPYVLNGDKGPQFVGLSRGGYGNPFDVTTTSGKPLADDLTVALKVGLREDDAAVVAKARETGATRIVVLSLREWKSDTMLRTALLYGAALRVLDASGGLLAEVEHRGQGRPRRQRSESSEACPDGRADRCAGQARGVACGSCGRRGPALGAQPA